MRKNSKSCILLFLLGLISLMIISCSGDNPTNPGDLDTTKDDIIGKWQINAYDYTGKDPNAENTIYWFEFTEDGEVTFGFSEPSLMNDGTLLTQKYTGSYTVTGNTVDIQFTDDNGTFSGENTVDVYSDYLRWRSGTFANLEQIHQGYMEKVEEFQFVRTYKDTDGLVYLIKEGYASIIDIDTTVISNPDLVIPSSVSFSAEDGEVTAVVNEIALAAFLIDENETSNLSSVTIPASIKVIGNNAFSGSSISSVTFEDREDEIEFGSGVFSNCINLESFTFPNWMKEIPASFLSGSGIRTITVPSTIETINGNSFFECNLLTYADLSSVSISVIPNSLFQNCTSLTEVKLPETVQEFEQGVFYGCSSLESIPIPNTVTSIGSSAFEKSGIKNVDVPGTVSVIGIGLFRDCENLESVTLNNGTTEIRFGAFSNCTSLQNITIPSTVTSIDEYAFSEAKINTITFTGTRAEWDALNINWEHTGATLICSDNPSV